MQPQNPGSISQFILKLLSMMRECPTVISFSDSGKEVLILSFKKFIKTVLPQYFRHNKWRSFVRQMNMYGFKKLNRGFNIYMFASEIFWQGNEDNYHLIKRKYPSKASLDFNNAQINGAVFRGLKDQYKGSNMGDFILTVLNQTSKIEETCKKIKKSLEMVNHNKKSAFNPALGHKIKDIVQTISEAAVKFKRITSQEGEHYGEKSIEGNQSTHKIASVKQQELSEEHFVLQNSPIIPKPINSNVSLFPNLGSQQNIEANSNKKVSSSTQTVVKTNQRAENTFVISKGCSFTSLMDI